LANFFDSPYFAKLSPANLLSFAVLVYLQGCTCCCFRCYVIDDSSNIIFSDGLRQADQLDFRNYNRVPLGRVEPGVMRDLVREKRFFAPDSIQVDFQGVCERLDYFVPVRKYHCLKM